MTAKSYSRLAAAVFSIVAVLQFSRAVMGWQVIVGSHSMPVWPSWIAFLVTGTLAYLGFSVARE
jgi:hypothetical protein